MSNFSVSHDEPQYSWESCRFFRANKYLSESWKTDRPSGSILSERFRADLFLEFVAFSSHEQRTRKKSTEDIFRKCVGLLDGYEIYLSEKYIYVLEAYFNKKKYYGFNLQAYMVSNHVSRWLLQYSLHPATS